MKNQTRSALIIGAALVSAGCGGSQPPGLPAWMPQSPSFAVHSDHTGSWMAPGSAKDNLLNITNRDTVTVYSYPKGEHVGTLKGFYQPEAECVDKAGDIFVGDGSTITEYPHGGTQPIQTLSLSGYFLGGCSSDPITGNLAVAGGSQVSTALLQFIKMQRVLRPCIRVPTWL